MRNTDRVLTALKTLGGIADSLAIQRCSELSQSSAQSAGAALERRNLIERCGVIKRGAQRIYVYSLRKARRR